MRNEYFISWALSVFWFCAKEKFAFKTITAIITAVKTIFLILFYFSLIFFWDYDQTSLLTSRALCRLGNSIPIIAADWKYSWSYVQKLIVIRLLELKLEFAISWCYNVEFNLHKTKCACCATHMLLIKIKQKANDV